MRLQMGASAILFCANAFPDSDSRIHRHFEAKPDVYKHRNVRFCYPSPLVELALHLCKRHKVKDIAEYLRLPPATLYRWRLDRLSKQKNLSRSNNGNPKYEDICLELVNRCEQYGFPVRERLTLFKLLDSQQRRDFVDAGSEPNFARSPQVERNESVEPETLSLSGVAQDNGQGKHYRFSVARARRSRRVLERLLRARELIETRFNFRLTCEQLAHVAGMSLHHFVRVYKQAFGESAQQHLSRVRVSHARTLLQSTSQPAALIAVAVGFDSYATLSKAFKSVTGLNVSEFCRASPQSSMSHMKLAESVDSQDQRDLAFEPQA